MLPPHATTASLIQVTIIAKLLPKVSATMSWQPDHHQLQLRDAGIAAALVLEALTASRKLARDLAEQRKKEGATHTQGIA